MVVSRLAGETLSLPKSSRDRRTSIDYHSIPGMMVPAKQGVRPTKPARSPRLTRVQRTAVLRALADPKRFELLERIARASSPLSCTTVRGALAISPATLSHHIKELQACGLIDVRREGKFHFLLLRPGVLDAVAAHLQSFTSNACPAR